MKIELNLTTINYELCMSLVEGGFIELNMLPFEKKFEYLSRRFFHYSIIERDDVTLNDKVKIIKQLIESETIEVGGPFNGQISELCEFVKTNLPELFNNYLQIKLINSLSATSYDSFEALFAGIDYFDIEVNNELKKQIKTNFWKYVERCNTYATATHIYPENTPEWCVNLYLGDYDNIHRRIALHKATGWKHYNPNNPDNRVQVRAAYADFAGTKKGQAIHDNAYSLRKRAVKEHNLKLVSKKG